MFSPLEQVRLSLLLPSLGMLVLGSTEDQLSPFDEECSTLEESKLSSIGDESCEVLQQVTETHFQAKQSTWVPAGASVPHQQGQHSSQVYQHQCRP